MPLSSRAETFCRIAIALAVSKGIYAEAADYAAGRWGAANPAAQILKSAVLASGLRGSDMASFRIAAAEFFNLVSARSAVGSIAGLRRVPFDARLLSVASGSTAYWVAETKGKPVSRVTFATSNLDRLKLTAIAVLTNELLLADDVQAENAVRRDLVRATAEALDLSFVDPSNTGVAGQEPASITAGASGVSSTGNANDDIRMLIQEFGGNLLDAVFIMSPLAAANLSSEAHPNIGAKGGEILGIPAVVTANQLIPGLIILADANQIAFAEDGADLRVSGNASIEMEDSPTEGATSLTSFWQTNSTGLLIERFINWHRMTDDAVVFIEDASWAMPTT